MYSVCRCGHRGAEAPASVVHLMTMTIEVISVTVLETTLDQYLSMQQILFTEQ